MGQQHQAHAEHPSHNEHAGHDPNIFKQKFWISLVLSVPTLFFSHTIQGWLGFHLEFTGSEYIPALFGLIIFGYGGMVFIKGARQEIINRQPGMMTLISMAISIAMLYSLAVTATVVDGMDFWWELATLVTIMLLGHWLEMTSIMRARSALHELARLLPDEAEITTNQGTKHVAISAVHVGDHVLIRPGGRIPADGNVVKGTSDVNEAMLTGESQPVQKKTGDSVAAGTSNGSGSLTVQVAKTGDDTAIAGIMRLVAEAEASKSKTQILADKAASYLTYAAIATALMTAIGWSIAGESAGFILERVVTVLIIACPHALGLAIPLVTSIATTLAAKRGILIRKRIALEAARNIDVVLFDKTGTLTEGKQGVVDIMATGSEHALLAAAASVEYESEHSIARAIVAAARQRHISYETAQDFSAIPGRGARATLNGQQVYVGSPALATALAAAVPEAVQVATQQAAEQGKTVIYVIWDKTVQGAVILADVIRDESKEAVALLQAQGKRVAVLTGDSEGVAAWVSQALGISEYFAEVAPERKAAVVTQLQADGSKVAMVGDGINDAPALVQADIGVAIGAGTDVAVESAGIILAANDPRGVANIITLSQATYRKMQQNLVWAVGYNVVSVPLAAGVTAGLGFILSPALGAVLMSASTIIVAVNAQLLRRSR